ncbi:hypothetical protein B0H14DRAFT_2581844 [Mycena olivaceomarginata]|nr:hypothetical protein B0H14DRAFT_2581844 [Mycena olivaceomarginata]
MFKNLRSAGELSWNVQLRPDFVKVFEAQGFGLGIFICIHREKGPSIDRQIQPIQWSTENDWEIASETRNMGGSYQMRCLALRLLNHEASLTAAGNCELVKRVLRWVLSWLNIARFGDKWSVQRRVGQCKKTTPNGDATRSLEEDERL